MPPPPLLLLPTIPTFSSALCDDTSAAKRLKPAVYLKQIVTVFHCGSSSFTYAASAATPCPPSFEKLPTRKMRS